MARDLLAKYKVHIDRLPLACSSDATSDSVSDGVGVSFNGWQRATIIGIFADPATSDATGLVRAQYTANKDTASDNSASDYSNFDTDAVSSETPFATSDDAIATGEGVVAVRVNLGATSLTHGCIRGQYLSNGGAAVSCGIIILEDPTGMTGGLESGPTAVTPSSY